uniref:4,5-DOPA-extradiol-dioxygenase n=1 Tax=Lampropedia cohaerens TaxID=1610491 RepID=UPI0012E35206|nr:4,5-DOPA dioxygenase extradiol [Lampropedia cohaerens]
MQRRHLLGALSALASPGFAAPQVQPLSAATLAQTFGGLRPSTRQPVLFVGHGSPLNVLPGNVWHDSWRQLGARLLAQAEPPQLIVSISAHWLTRGGWQVTGMATPRTIHDFGGFPDALYTMQYPAPGHPAAAAALADALGQGLPEGIGMEVDTQDWGLDHGTWSVLLPMFPQAAIPVLQLSLDYAMPWAEHYRFGQQLRQWRDHGVLVLGSGNIVHNLRRMQYEASPHQAYDWALEFDEAVYQRIQRGELAALAEFSPDDPLVRLAHPTYDHYLPLLYAAAATYPDEPVEVFNRGFQLASVSMQSVLWGAASS